ncbi:MAG: deoxynucleoside kinase [Candidatus Lokiarchaeota archaeon]|nr:deoxynucleoside kinase [Candidatus Lokiarchaeota archaeon]
MSKIIYRNKGSKDNIVISIAGAHGIGKTTIFNLFKSRVQNNNKFKFFPERYVKNPPFPFGSPNKQIGFRSELHFLQQLIKRNQNITNFDNNYNGRIIILDRTPLCVLIYSKSLKLKEKDYILILDTFKSIQWKEDYIFYLYANPSTIIKRIIQRGSLEKIRKDWNEEDKEYLLTILSYYKQFLSTKEGVFMLDTDNKSPDQVINEMKKLITQVSGYSFEKEEKSISTQQMNIMKFLK